MIQIRELWIDGFGCLRTGAEPLRFDRGRITLFLDDNEVGKSTLQTALLASFYGVEDDERRKLSPRPRRAHWAPIAGGQFGTRLRLVSHLHFAHGGNVPNEDVTPRNIEVRWDFAKGNDLSVVDLDTNKLITAEMCPGADTADLGRRILGVGIEEFLKTFFVAQDDLRRVRDPEGLHALLQRSADSQAGSTTVASAQEALRALLRNYPGVMLKGTGKIENEIARLEDAIGSLERHLAELDAARAALAEQDAEFQGLTAQRDELRQEAARLDYLAHAAELEELKLQVEDAQKRRATLAALEAERAKLAPLEAFPADQHDHLRQWQADRLAGIREAEQAERAIAEVRLNALEPDRAELDKLGPLATVAQDDVDAVQQLLGKTRAFEADEQRSHDDVVREESQLASQGASVEDLDRLEERFDGIGPDDAQFLLDRDRAADRASSGVEEAKRLSAEAALAIDRINSERKLQREAGRRLLLAGGCVALATVAVGAALALLWSWSPLPAVALAVLGLGGAAWLALRGHRAATTAAVLQADELALAQRARSDAEDRQARLAADSRDRGRRLHTLATQFGYEQPEVLVEDHTSLDDLRRLCGTLIVLRKREAERATQRGDLEAEVAAGLRRWGAELPPGIPLSRALTHLQERMTHSVRLRHRIDGHTRKLSEQTERHDALRNEAEALTARIRELFAAAGIEQGESVEKNITAFAERARQHQRLRQLADELVPQASSGVLDPKKIDAMRADADRLHRVIVMMREERPALLSLPVKEGSREYRRRRDDAARREAELRASADEKAASVLGTLKRYHAERPKLEDALTERRAELACARRHAAAIELAATQLDQIAHEVHGLWAEGLNRSASALLHRIAPSLSDLRFDSHLAFGVRHRDLPEPIHSTEARPLLSTGAWDQLCLAVRLAITDFVGTRTQGGVLLLDDPFAHFDDARFEAAIHLLGELARSRHQVILFSCQTHRFQWLRERDPQWFGTNLAVRSIRRARSSP